MKINLAPNIKEPIRLLDWRNPFLSQGRDTMKKSTLKEMTNEELDELSQKIEEIKQERKESWNIVDNEGVDIFDNRNMMDVTCPVCNGSGEVKSTITRNGKIVSESIRSCQHCGGSGIVQQPEPVSIGYSMSADTPKEEGE